MELDNLDRTTIVSVFPLPIYETKPGIYPGRFAIPGANGDPGVLTIGQSLHYVYIGDDRPSLPVVHSSKEVAEAVVNDFVQAQIAVNEGAKPGIGFLRGAISLIEVKTRHQQFLKDLTAQQKQWYIALVKLADDDWQKYHKHIVISDVQRIAAKDLGLEREWLMAVDDTEKIKCPACATEWSSEVVVCANCKCILNKEKYDKLQFVKG